MAKPTRSGAAARDAPVSAPEKRLEGLLDWLTAQRGVHHAIMAVESLNGAFRWVGCAGDANPGGAPMRHDTPFFIASITKTYIASAIMRLTEDGLVRLDDPLRAYLPPALIAGLHKLGGVDHTDSITVRHLLSHTSGLPDYIEDSPTGGRSLIERLVSDGDMAWDIEDVVAIVRELTPYFPPQPRDAPRPRARYSDTGFRLLIAIIEAVTSLPLGGAFAKMLFGPLGLRHTFLTGDAPVALGPAPAALWFGDQPVNLPLALRSAGDLYSTVDDTLRFLRALVCGEVFRNPTTMDLMQQRWVRFGVPRDRAALRAPNWPIEYGLGLMRYRLPRAFTPFRPMPAVIGHTGSTGCWLFHCRRLGVLLTGSVDQITAGPVPYRMMPRMLHILARAVDERAQPRFSSAQTGERRDSSPRPE